MAGMLGRPRPGGVGAGRALVALLIFTTTIEFLLGTAVNLYTTCLPDGPMHLFSSDPCAASSGQSILEAHVVVGVVLGLLALALLFWAVRRRTPRVTGPAFGGFLGVVIAAIGGYEYLAINPNPADYSFLMALGFLMAFGAYMSAAFALRDYARTGGAAVRWMPPPASNPPP